MAHYYLARFVQYDTGKRDDAGAAVMAWRPSGIHLSPPADTIELGPPVTPPGPWCILVTSTDVGEVAGVRISLGTDPHALNLRAKAALELRLGVVLSALTLRGMVRELLTVHGDGPLDVVPLRWRNAAVRRRRRRIVLGDAVVIDEEA